MGAQNAEVSDSSSDDDAKTMAVGGLVLGSLGFLFGAASLCIVLSRGSKKPVAREISFGKDKGGVTDAKGSV